MKLFIMKMYLFLCLLPVHSPRYVIVRVMDAVELEKKTDSDSVGKIFETVMQNHLVASVNRTFKNKF